MSRRIMILGAGIYQVPLIKKVKEMDLIALVVSPKGNYPGIVLADIFIELDTRDKELILKNAIEYKIDGIITTGTDAAVPSIGYVIDKLNLYGTGYNAACKCTDKILMKQCLMENNIATAKYYISSNLEDLVSQANSIGYPVIVKAPDSSGSRGITKVEKESELKRAFDSAKSVSKLDNIIVEEYLNGFEIGAQAIVIESEVVEVFIHSDEVTPPPISVPIGHSLPLELDKKLEADIKILVSNTIKALDIRNTISNVDLMIVNNKPYILEIGARMGATCLPENISIYSGIDFYKFLIHLSLGIQSRLNKNYKNQANTSLLLRAYKNGKIKSIYIPDEFYKREDIYNISLDVKVGDKVNKFSVGPDRIGHIIVNGKNIKETLKLATLIEKQISINIE